jgi:hypothetical protein
MRLKAYGSKQALALEYGVSTAWFVHEPTR